MSDCEKYIEMMSAMVDGELTAEQKAELRAHIAVCPYCAGVYEAFKDISGAISEELVTPPETLAEGIMYKIKLRKRVNRRFAFGPFTAVAACLVLAFFGALHFGLFGGAKTSETMSAPEPEVTADQSRDYGAQAEIPEAAGGGQETTDGSIEAAQQSGDNASDSNMENTMLTAGVSEKGCGEGTVLQFGFSSQSVTNDETTAAEDEKEPDFLFDAKEMTIYEGRYYPEQEDAGKNKLLYTLTTEDELNSLYDLVTAIPDDDVEYSPEDGGIMKTDPLYTLYVPADREKDEDAKDKVICVWFVDDEVWCVISDAETSDPSLKDDSEKIIYKAEGVRDEFEKYIEDIKKSADIT